MLLVVDLVGVFVFALSGATAAVRQRLDFFGVLVLSFATASAGGILRDLLIGAVPLVFRPETELYALAALAGSLVVSVGHWLEWPALPTAIWGRGAVLRAAHPRHVVRLAPAERASRRQLIDCDA
jgi:uncharacterized membrane protein YeiH